jgi:hypothetical protein
VNFSTLSSGCGAAREHAVSDYKRCEVVRQVQVTEDALLRDRAPADNAEPEAQHPVLREKFVEDLVQLASTAPVSTTTNVRDERHTYPRCPCIRPDQVYTSYL